MGIEKRAHERKPLRLELNYRHSDGGDFLYEESSNISHGGIFILTKDPLPVGADLVIRFTPPGGGDEVQVDGTVAWVNVSVDTPNPGMGIAFSALSTENRDTIAGIVKAIAIL